MPVQTLRIWQSAINSASSSARCMDSTVASMFTTTPFFNPLESCCPSPMTSCRPLGSTSATTATTFEVPISRPTIRFFASFVIIFKSLIPLSIRRLVATFPNYLTLLALACDRPIHSDSAYPHSLCVQPSALINVDRPSQILLRVL